MEINELEKSIWFLQYSLYTEAISIDRIIEAINTDGSLCKLQQCMQEHTKQYLPNNDTDLIPYSKILSELTESDECFVTAIALERSH